MIDHMVNLKNITAEITIGTIIIKKEIEHTLKNHITKVVHQDITFVLKFVRMIIVRQNRVITNQMIKDSLKPINRITKFHLIIKYQTFVIRKNVIKLR